MAAEWRALGHSPGARQALDRLAAAEPDVAAAGATDLGSLVAILHRARGPAERDRAAALVRAMLRSLDLHPLVPRALLQALVPGLVTVARRLSWGAGGDWEDGGAFFADVLTTAWEVVTGWAGQDRPYAVLDILSAVRCRARRQILGQRDGRRRHVADVDPDLLAAAWTPGDTDLDVLARAIEDLAGHGVDRSDAAFLYANRVLGLSVAELAALTGRSRRHVVRRRDRAAEDFLQQLA